MLNIVIFATYRNSGGSCSGRLCLLILLVVLTVLCWVLETLRIQSKMTEVYKAVILLSYVDECFFNISIVLGVKGELSVKLRIGFLNTK